MRELQAMDYVGNRGPAPKGTRWVGTALAVLAIMGLLVLRFRLIPKNSPEDHQAIRVQVCEMLRGDADTRETRRAAKRYARRSPGSAETLFLLQVVETMNGNMRVLPRGELGVAEEPIRAALRDRDWDGAAREAAAAADSGGIAAQRGDLWLDLLQRLERLDANDCRPPAPDS